MKAIASRRAFLVGTAAVIPAMAMPVIATEAAIAAVEGPRRPDRIFALIEKHRRLCTESEAIALQCEELEAKLPNDVRAEPSVPTFPEREHSCELIERTENGTEIIKHAVGALTGKMYTARDLGQLRIEAKSLPRDHRAAWIADRHGALKREKKRIQNILDETGYTKLSNRRSRLDIEEYDTGQELITTRPTTLEGVAALAIYVAECPSAEYSLMPDGDDKKIVLQNIASAIRAQMPTLIVDAGPARGGRRG